MVESPRPWTATDKSSLAQRLKRTFGDHAVEERGKLITLQTAAGEVDVVPLRAEFLPGQRNAAPTNRFLANPKGQQVVRNVKMRSQQEGRGWKGDAIERQTLKAQQESPKLANFELERIVYARLSGQ